MSKSEAVAAANKYLNDADAKYYCDLITTSAHLEHASSPSCDSHLGGEPILDSDSWPTWDEKPLNFFYEAKEQQVWGFDPRDRDGWRVIYTSVGSGSPVSAPVGAQTFEKIPLNVVEGV